MEDNKDKMIKFQNEILKRVSNKYNMDLNDLKDKCAYSKKEFQSLFKDKSKRPKRPLTGYFHFMNEYRTILKEKYPEDKATELSKKIAEIWKKMNEKEKEPYQKKFEVDKIRYENEKKELEKDLPVKSKKPKTAYFCFMDDVRDKYRKDFPNEKMNIISKKMGEAWKGLSEKDKQKYVDISHKQKELSLSK